MAACQWRGVVPVVLRYLAVERTLRAGRAATHGRSVDLMATRRRVSIAEGEELEALPRA